MSQFPVPLSNEVSMPASPEIPPVPPPAILVQSFSPSQPPTLPVLHVSSASPSISTPPTESSPPTESPPPTTSQANVQNDASSSFQSTSSPSHDTSISHQERCPLSSASLLDPSTNFTNEREHRTPVSEGQSSGSFMSHLRAQSLRLHIAKLRAQFEHTLLTLLMLNVIYMYYIDHKLLVLIIRGAQLIRLFYFPYSTPNAQRGTVILLLVSNIPVLLIHKFFFTGPNISQNLGDMLFINFIGEEPKSLFKVLFVDFITIILQALILQCRWDPSSIYLLSALPVPASAELIPIDEDPNIARPTEPATEEEHQNSTEDISIA